MKSLRSIYRYIKNIYACYKLFQLQYTFRHFRGDLYGITESVPDADFNQDVFKGITQKGAFNGINRSITLKNGCMKSFNHRKERSRPCWSSALCLLRSYWKISVLTWACIFLNPIRNRILNDMRSNMYGKILQLPIRLFQWTEERGYHEPPFNDLGDVEGSTVSVLESVFVNRSPFFFPRLHDHPEPAAHVIPGNISSHSRFYSWKNRTVVEERKQDGAAAIRNTVQPLKTLGGIRIIKAFNAEKKNPAEIWTGKWNHVSPWRTGPIAAATWHRLFQKLWG